MPNKNSRFHKITKFLTRARSLNIRIGLLIFVALLSIGAALLEGGTVACLALLAQVIITRDFSAMRSTSIFHVAARGIPALSDIPAPVIFSALLGLVVTLTILKHAIIYLSGVTVLHETRTAADKIRRLIFHRYMNFGKMFYDRSNAGHLHTVLLFFPSWIAYHISGLQAVMTSLFTFIIYLAMMFIISWQLTLLIMLIFPILHYSVKWLIRKIEETSRAQNALQIKISSNVFNILSCVPLVKLYKQELAEGERFARISGDMARLEFSMDKKNSLIGPIQDTVLVLAVLCVASIMAVIASHNKEASISGFLVYLYLLKKAQGGIGIPNSIKTIRAAISGLLSELAQIFNDDNKFFIPQGNRVFGGFKDRIEFAHLNFSYIKERQIIHDVSFSIEKNTTTALVGPTGSGKTTIASLLLRFYDCPPGTIFIDGCDIRDFTLQSLMRSFAYVSQDTLLFNDTMRNNITYGLDACSQDALIDAVRKARLYDFIMSLPDKFDTIIGDRGVKLSGGEKQRLSIARALLKDAEILILDEATSSLDSRTERLIQEAIDDAIEDRTALVIAHRLSTIKNADKIVVIEDGRLVEEGGLQQLLDKKGTFYQYWQEQKFY